MSNIKKPTGLSITRTGRKFKASWKKGGSYSTMQCAWGYQTPNSIVEGKIVPVSHTHSVKTFNDTVTFVTFAVRGKKNGKWSDWAEKSVRIYVPKTPDVSAEFVQTAKTTFSWNPVTDNHERPIINAIVQTILVKDCPDGRDAIASLPEWSDENNMTEYTRDESGSITPVDGEGEDTGLLSGKSYTRIVRVKEVGIGGESGWGYAKHIYAAPYPATNIRGTVKKTEASLNCQMYWETPTDAGHPIDEDGVVPQYSIAKPAPGMACPDEATFEPLPPQGSTEGTEGKSFTIDTPIGIDKALFLRVTTQHDTDIVQSNAVLADGDSVGALQLPAFTEAPAITATTVTVKATNESEVEDSFIVDYLERADGSLEILGLHDTSTKVYQVSDIENARVGVKAYVGEWNSILKTVNNIQMESAMLWSAGNVPVAPSLDDFDVEQSTVANTVLVGWKYSWDDADACEVSWSTEPDAWMSTEDPEYYVVLRGLENKLAIKGVDPGEPLYVRIRYMNGFDDDAILSPYSDIKSIIISTVPAIPTLTLEKQYYTNDEDITCSWVYITTDGTEQAHAQIAEQIVTTVGGSTNISYDPILDVDTEQRAVLKNKWPVGTQHALAVRVANSSGNWSEWSEAVVITIAEPVECHITEHTLEYDTVPVNPETRTGSLITLNGGDETNVRDVTSLQVTLEPVQAGTPAQGSEASDAYLMKASPTTDFNSEYLTVVGGTVAWNQMIQKRNYDTRHNGVTLEATTDKGVYHYVGTWVQASSTFGVEAGTVPANHVVVMCVNNLNLDGIATNKVLFLDNWSTKHQFTDSNPFIYKTTSATTLRHGINSEEVTTCDISYIPMLFDLTQMFGSTIADYIYSLEQATAGTGVAFFRKLFPKSYYAYNAGELMSVKTSSHQMVGFNQFDKSTATDGKFVNASGQEVTSPNYGHSAIIPVFPSTTYYMKGYAGTSYYTVLALDIEQNPIGTFYGGASKTEEFSCTLPSNCYYVILNYLLAQKDSVCFNLSWDGERDGEYEEYVKHSYALDDITLRGIPKLDSNNNLYYDGDEYESDGTVNRKYGIVDLGTLNWSYYNNRFDTTLSDIQGIVGWNQVGWICSHLGKGVVLPNETANDKCLGVYNKMLFVRYNSTTTVADFKTAMSGVYLVYELATPTTEEADAFTSPQVAYPYGTESFTDTRAVQIPVGTKHRYASIYLITGHDSVGVTDTGVNQWDEQYRNGYYSSTTGEFTANSQMLANKNPIRIMPNTTYYLKSTTYSIGLTYYDDDMNFISQTGAFKDSTFTTPPNAHYLNFANGWNAGNTYNNDISINYPATDHDYHAYTGSTYTATLPQTVYGGTANIVAGTGKVTRGYVDLGTLTWNYSSQNADFFALLPNGKVRSDKSNAVCSAYEVIDGARTTLQNGQATTNMYGFSASSYVIIKDTAYTDAATFKTAMSGVQLVYELATPTDLTLTPQSITLNEGTNNVWSENGNITIKTADAVEYGYYLRDMPLRVTVTGAGAAGRTVLMIERTDDYRIERPEGEDFRGNVGEVVWQKAFSGEGQQEIILDDLQGHLDDGAKYRIYALVYDEYGQDDDDEIPFIVNWRHKATKPNATVEMTDIAKITIAQSALAEEGDYVDIYRRSIDGAELIYTGAQFGETYVDPYPTIGNFGYLIVGRSMYGDYVMEEAEEDYGQLAWRSVPAEYSSEKTLIDFNGDRIELYYNVDVSHSWAKDFKKTKYLGGSIVGDYVAGVERTASINFVSIPMIEEDMLESMRRLAEYEGEVHIRTREGSSFTACVQVNEDDNHDKAGFVRSFSMTVDKVDPVRLDGMTEAEWEEQNAVE